MKKAQWLFCQYTAGAGGKAISCCLQTANNVASWWEQRPSIESLIESHTNDINHVRREPDADYKLTWLSRTYGIDRGDDLDVYEVNHLLRTDDKIKKIINNNEMLLISWNKITMPKWFDGKLIQIINDEESLSWLVNRRKKLFYVETSEGIIEVRYDSRYHPKPERNDRCVSSLPLDELVSKQFIAENIQPNSRAHQIQLSWLLNQQWNILFDCLENAVNDRIDREWCEQYLTDWHKKTV